MKPTAPRPSVITEILLTEEQIRTRVAALGQQITADYRGKDLILLCVLKGSAMVAADLMRCVDLPLSIDFIAISSYGESTHTSGVVRLVKDMEEDIGGRHVLVVEDIVDSGLTLNYLLKALRMRNPASLKVCSLLSKPARRRVEIPIDYLGFTIEDRFVVGYGLDYLNHYRNLPYIGVLDPELEDARPAQ